MDEAIDFHLHRQPHLSPRSRLFVLGSMQERCTRFEAVFMRLTLHMGRTMAVPEGATPASRPTVSCPFQRFTKLGTVRFRRTLRVSVATGAILKSCRRFFRGRWGLALRVRCRAKLERDMDAERGIVLPRADDDLVQTEMRWFSGSRLIGEADR